MVCKLGRVNVVAGGLGLVESSKLGNAVQVFQAICRREAVVLAEGGLQVAENL